MSAELSPEPTAWVICEDGDERDLWDDLFWTREDAESAARGLDEDLTPVPLYTLPAAAAHLAADPDVVERVARALAVYDAADRVRPSHYHRANAALAALIEATP